MPEPSAAGMPNSNSKVVVPPDVTNSAEAVGFEPAARAVTVADVSSKPFGPAGIPNSKAKTFAVSGPLAVILTVGELPDVSSVAVAVGVPKLPVTP